MTRFVIPGGGTRFVIPGGGTRFVIPGGGTRFVIPRGGTRSRRRASVLGAFVIGCALLVQGCSKRPSHEECEALLDRYVELLVNSDRPGTNAAELHKLQLQAREKAKEDPEFSACSERVSRRELDCAMNASNADLLEQCLL